MPYRIYGVLYLLLAVPALVALASGTLKPGPGANAYLPLSLGGIPLGALYLAFSFDRFHRQYLSDTAVRVGAVGLLQLVFMGGAWLVIQSGRQGFLTAYLFFGMATTFLALTSLVLLIIAARRGPSQES
jgi:hypothetical protein